MIMGLTGWEGKITVKGKNHELFQHISEESRQGGIEISNKEKGKNRFGGRKNIEFRKRVGFPVKGRENTANEQRGDSA